MRVIISKDAKNGGGYQVKGTHEGRTIYIKNVPGIREEASWRKKQIETLLISIGIGPLEINLENYIKIKIAQNKSDQPIPDIFHYCNGIAPKIVDAWITQEDNLVVTSRLRDPIEIAAKSFKPAKVRLSDGRMRTIEWAAVTTLQNCRDYVCYVAGVLYLAGREVLAADIKDGCVRIAVVNPVPGTF